MTACEKKLFLCLVVLAHSALWRLPEGRCLDRLCLRCDGSALRYILPRMNGASKEKKTEWGYMSVASETEVCGSSLLMRAAFMFDTSTGVFFSDTLRNRGIFTIRSLTI